MYEYRETKTLGGNPGQVRMGLAPCNPGKNGPQYQIRERKIDQHLVYRYNIREFNYFSRFQMIQ